MKLKIKKIENDLKRKLAREFVKFLLPYLFIFATMNLISTIVPVFHPSRMIPIILAILGLLIAALFHRRSKDFAACHAINLVWVLSISLAISLNGGISAPAFMAYFIPLLIIGWLTNYLTTILYSLLYIMIGFTAVILEKRGLLPQSRDLPLMIRMFFYSNYIMVVTVITLLGNRILRQTLRENFEKQELLDSTFSSIGDAILALDREHRIVQQNEGASRIFSLLKEKEKDNIFENHVFEFEDYGKMTLSDYIKTTGGNVSSQKLRTSDAKHKAWYQLNVTPLMQGRDVTGTILTIRDITEQVEFEYHRAMTQKMDVVGQLASGIAHDFNNMLGSIQGATELIQQEAREDQKEMLSLIRKAVDKASELTGELLLFTRKAPKQSTAVDVHKIIEEVVFLLGRTLNKNISITKELEAPGSFVIGDNNQIENALVNMAINSSHAMEEGGTLTFRTRELTLDEHFCTHSDFEISPGTYINIEVKDTGRGIPSDVREHIFEPFYTTKEVGKGTGLGLSAVYGMIQKHKGAITVESELGRGTSFQIYLPLETDSKYLNKEQNHIEIKNTFGSGTILVVDDENFIRITAKEMLRSLGYTVFCVQNGEEALSFLEKESVDLVILDMIMPGLSGKDTFKAMLEHKHTMPVILSSGFSEEADLKEVKALGIFGFIRKPYNSIDLSRIVSQAMTSTETAESSDQSRR